VIIYSILRWILGLACALALIYFSVLNRQHVTVEFGPLQEPIDLPLYALACGFLVIGFMIGGVLVWLNHAPLRHTRRLQKRQIKALEKELEAVNENQPGPSTADKIQTALLTKK